MTKGDNVDTIGQQMVERYLDRLISSDNFFDEALVTPNVVINERSFINIVVRYYKDPTIANRKALISLIKKPYTKITVVSNYDHNKVLFVFPSVFSQIDPNSDSGRVTTLEKMVTEANLIRNRAKLAAETYLAMGARSFNLFKTDEATTNTEIIDILKRYGVVLASGNGEKNKEETSENITNDNKSEGYIDEW